MAAASATPQGEGRKAAVNSQICNVNWAQLGLRQRLWINRINAGLKYCENAEGVKQRIRSL